MWVCVRQCGTDLLCVCLPSRPATTTGLFLSAHLFSSPDISSTQRTKTTSAPQRGAAGGENELRLWEEQTGGRESACDDRRGRREGARDGRGMLKGWRKRDAGEGKFEGTGSGCGEKQKIGF